MKEIKFRAWDKENKALHPVHLIGGSIIKVPGFEWENIEDFEVMQYTGLRDKSGTEIYEGDILKVYELSNHNEQEYISPVEYIESGFLVTEPSGTQVPLACFHNLETTYPLFEIEVTGNIYENPALLGGESNE